MPITQSQYKGTTWHNAVAPNQEELQSIVIKLKEQFGFHELALEDCASTNQRPKVDDYGDYLFLVLHFPRYNKATRRITTREIEIFIGGDYIITLHDDSLKPLSVIEKEITENERAKKDYLGKGPGFFLYEIVSTLLEYCFPVLDKIGHTISDLEQDILNEEGDVVKDHLKEIMLVKRNIIRFRRIMLPMRSVIVSLDNQKSAILPKKYAVYFDDAIDHIEHIWDLLTSYKELIEALQETNESIISNRTNNVVKILTLFSVTLLPLTFITGLYGMNIPNLPYANSPGVFHAIVIIMVAIVAIMLIFSKLRKWF